MLEKLPERERDRERGKKCVCVRERDILRKETKKTGCCTCRRKKKKRCREAQSSSSSCSSSSLWWQTGLSHLNRSDHPDQARFGWDSIQTHWESAESRSVIAGNGRFPKPCGHYNFSIMAGLDDILLYIWVLNFAVFRMVHISPPLAPYFILIFSITVRYFQVEALKS